MGETGLTGILTLDPSAGVVLTTINDAIVDLEGELQGSVSKTLDNDGSTTLTDEEALRNMIFVLGTGQTLTQDEDVLVPDSTSETHSAQKFYLVKDDTTNSAFEITFKTINGTGVKLRRGEYLWLFSDGTNIVPIERCWEFVWYAGGAIGTSAKLIEVPVSRRIVIPAGMPNSNGYAGTAPSGGAASFDIKKNGTNQGTMDFANGSQTATFTMSSAVTLDDGDRLSVVEGGAPNSIADVGFTFRLLELGGGV